MKVRAIDATALLLVLVPLAALAWFGSGELARQTERAENLLEEQAQNFVTAADSRIRTAIDRRIAAFDEMLAAVEALPHDGATQGVGRVDRELHGRDPLVLGFVALDAAGRLLCPLRSPSQTGTLPFKLPTNATRRAETLEVLGDLEGARDAWLDLVTDNRDTDNHETLLRAHFALGGIERRRHQLDAAGTHYLAATVEAERLGGNPRYEMELPTIDLLVECGFAEIPLVRGRGGQSALELASAISDGYHDRCADEVLGAVFERLIAVAEDDAPTAARLAALQRTDAQRRASRRFAAEFAQTAMDKTIKRRLDRAGSAPVQHVFAGADGNSLLVLRRAAENEAPATHLPAMENAAWIGLRLDLDQLLIDTVGDQVAGDGPFALSIRDAEGSLLVPGSNAAPSEERSASRTVAAGIQLSAVPLDLDRALSERRSQIRNRSLLLILLSATALFGAAFLIRSARREAELARLKVSLVSRVTHDLKTPLALIRMYAETLERGRARTPEEASRFAGIVSREADGLARAVDRILDFSRSQAGTLSYVPERVDLVEIAERAVEAWRPAATARGVDLFTDFAADEVPVDVDPRAAESVLRDLIENACKYARPKDGSAPPFVMVRVLREDGSAVVRVEDDGIGIPEGERERVFESFYRASNAGEVRGTGLGLALVKHFADAHDGRVEALAREGGGTVMRIRLPAHDDTEIPS
ncbi:MAG: HAMP domain-containing sensor histidine kinase [Planctomycetota bacterium]